MDLNEIMVFARVVQAGSFVAASARLGMPKSTVSRKVVELETRLNARLLQRTTRKLSLTDEGRTFYEYCARIVAEVEDAERAVSSFQHAPRGALRVTVGPNTAFLAPIIVEYLKRYPDVRFELVTTSRAVDLVEERFDLGIRAGTLADSTLVARSLGRIAWLLVATPGYLKKRGRPRTPEALEGHDLLYFGTGLDGVGPRLEKDGRTVRVALPSRLTAIDMEVIREATASGLGIGFLPAFQCVGAIREGLLVRVLPDWEAPAVPVHVVYPSTRHLSPRVKTFVEFLHARMTPPPWEVGESSV